MANKLIATEKLSSGTIVDIYQRPNGTLDIKARQPKPQKQATTPNPPRIVQPRRWTETLKSGTVVTINKDRTGKLNIIAKTPRLGSTPTPTPAATGTPKVTSPKTRKQRQDDAKKWFMKHARSAQGYRVNLLSKSDRNRSTVTMGKMYFFAYLAKHRDTLPIWDMFPLIFPIERYSDGFLGLNLHYLSGQQRKFFLELLKTHVNNKKFDETTKLKMTYDIVRRSAVLKMFATPCIKRYLTSHVQSDFTEITSDEWDYIIDLPLEQWVEK